MEPSGGRITFLVDPTMWDERNALPRAVYGDLDRVVRTDLYYHYATPVCAQRWLDVCDDPAYGHRDLLARVRGILPGLVDALCADVGSVPSVALSSLGPGDGSVDELILAGLDARCRVASYCGLDFSFELLRKAVHRIAIGRGAGAGFPIRAICGDFTDLGAIGQLHDDEADAQIFALTGFTLGNYGEAELLEDIGRLMRPGDYLFLDARLHDFGELPTDMSGFRATNGEAFRSYDLESVRRFVFGPAEVATMADVDHVRIDFDTTRSLTTVPDALNLLIYCTGLDTTVRLTGEGVRRERPDLAVTTLYHLPSLARWLASSTEFESVWWRDAGGVAFF
ncbi:MAG: L-histidine N(alpha)-methyltransferase, partial [Gemmatimonadota bacterium]